MNANLGITGFQIEDFEDTTLISGLSVSAYYSGALGLPDPFGAQWDGVSGLNPANGGGRGVVFDLAPTIAFGVGVSNLSFVNAFWLEINGGTPINMGALINSNNGGRNGYIQIEQEVGDDLITSVSLYLTRNDDGFTFDHLAVTAVPEPSSTALLGLGGLALMLRRR